MDGGEVQFVLGLGWVGMGVGGSPVCPVMGMVEGVVEFVLLLG